MKRRRDVLLYFGDGAGVCTATIVAAPDAVFTVLRVVFSGASEFFAFFLLLGYQCKISEIKFISEAKLKRDDFRI